jgi:hypothetical protein
MTTYDNINIKDLSSIFHSPQILFYIILISGAGFTTFSQVYAQSQSQPSGGTNTSLVSTVTQEIETTIEKCGNIIQFPLLAATENWEYECYTGMGWIKTQCDKNYNLVEACKLNRPKINKWLQDNAFDEIDIKYFTEHHILGLSTTAEGTSSFNNTSFNNTSIEIPASITGSDRETVERNCEMAPNLCSFYIDQYSKNSALLNSTMKDEGLR